MKDSDLTALQNIISLLTYYLNRECINKFILLLFWQKACKLARFSLGLPFNCTTLAPSLSWYTASSWRICCRPEAKRFFFDNAGRGYFLLWAESSISAWKLTFISWPGARMNDFRLTQKHHPTRTDIVDSWYVIRTFAANASLQLCGKKQKRRKSCLLKPGDELNKTNLQLLINYGSYPPHFSRNSRNADVIKRHILNRK